MAASHMDHLIRQPLCCALLHGWLVRPMPTAIASATGHFKSGVVCPWPRPQSKSQQQPRWLLFFFREMRRLTLVQPPPGSASDYTVCVFRPTRTGRLPVQVHVEHPFAQPVPQHRSKGNASLLLALCRRLSASLSCLQVPYPSRSCVHTQPHCIQPEAAPPKFVNHLSVIPLQTLRRGCALGIQSLGLPHGRGCD